MSITQTVEIPANHLLTIHVPSEVPEGKAQIVFTTMEKASGKAPTLLSLRGSCKGFDTMDAYFKRKQADKALEDRKYELKSGNS